MNNSIYKCPICGGPTNYSSINYQPQPCLHCIATIKPSDQQHGNDPHAPCYGTLFDAVKPKEQTAPAPTPWSAKSETYWREQYQLMHERSYKLMVKNSKQAERIVQLEAALGAMVEGVARKTDSQQAGRIRELEEHSTINDAIAEAIRWTGGWLAIPDFCGDLNAMHEAEMRIPEDKQALYDSHLVAIVGKETGLMPSLQFRCIHASAKQRAKAFLLTFGKWEEAK